MKKKWNYDTVKNLADRKAAHSGTLDSFFKKEGLSSSLFYYLAKKYLNKKLQTKKDSSATCRVIELSSAVSSGASVEICLKNGCRVKLRGTNIASQLQEILSMAGAI